MKKFLFEKDSISIILEYEKIMLAKLEEIVVPYEKEFSKLELKFVKNSHWYDYERGEPLYECPAFRIGYERTFFVTIKKSEGFLPYDDGEFLWIESPWIRMSSIKREFLPKRFFEMRRYQDVVYLGEETDKEVEEMTKSLDDLLKEIKQYIAVSKQAKQAFFHACFA